MPGKTLNGIDLSRPDLGNPGVGGTPFCFLLLAYYLNKWHNDEYIIEVLSKSEAQLPDGISNRILTDINDLPNIARENSILIMNKTHDMSVYDIIDQLSGVSVIVWSHNYLINEVANRIARSPNIKANVFVSKQMYDFYCDHDIIKKSFPIFNIVPDVDHGYRQLPETPVVTFMGMISEAKGIVSLLKIWKLVQKRHPEAQLNIIGGANLYNRNTKLGRFNIATESTENKMLPYITDARGCLKDNVHFLGILGQEKYQVFLNSTVGIVNPTASTETFGMGIIEMASAYLPVVTRNWNGHPDTALDGKTALLGISVPSMADKVCKLIEDKELNIRLGENAKKHVQDFSPERIIPMWTRLFQSINSGKIDCLPREISKPIWNNYKLVRRVNSFLRFNLRLSFLPSVVGIESMAYSIKKYLKTIF